MREWGFHGRKELLDGMVKTFRNPVFMSGVIPGPRGIGRTGPVGKAIKGLDREKCPALVVEMAETAAETSDVLKEQLDPAGPSGMLDDLAPTSNEPSVTGFPTKSEERVGRRHFPKRVNRPIRGGVTAVLDGFHHARAPGMEYRFQGGDRPAPLQYGNGQAGRRRFPPAENAADAGSGSTAPLSFHEFGHASRDGGRGAS